MRRSINSDLITLHHPKSPISEAYRTLRTNIQFSSFETTMQVIMVASAQRGEGKTTTISNLAVAYAHEGKKVLLVDSDLRTPVLHDLFSLQNQLGLTTILTNQSKWQETIKDTEVENLSLLTSGPIPPNPSELLSHQRMGMLMDTLKEHYDLILMDTSPVMGVTDSLVVSALCDGVILVVAAGMTDKELVTKTKANLERVNSRILGVVFNDIKGKSNARKTVFSR
ncbi:CpsD/CapB family tyrosine-protein kinase [Paenibacillus humicola]|uniref:CpsD/CapB family tyrosine-protein kinase n=1 Tax=Paenibacillus humicola TaxID=3110540 RepID=UPI00237BC10C|nr:CpsD/CapB family tyrosine-protein kinase [Paenibacillus humicola]